MPILQEEPSSLINSYKFLRRADLPPSLRLQIGIDLLYFSYHGQVTDFSEKYGVSRSFLYDLKELLLTHLSGLFSCKKRSVSSLSAHRDLAYAEILRLRLIGKCSLESISELLSLKDIALPHSTCFISQFLKRLGGNLGKMVNWQGKVVYASDEVFMIGHQPILVTVDPISSTILRIEHLERLTKSAWEQHWQSLMDAGIYPLSLVKDEGVAMKAATQASGIFEDVPIQTDTFHAISYRLGIYLQRLENEAYKAMEYEWDRQEKIKSAVSQSVIDKRIDLYQKARLQTTAAISQFEHFEYLYFCIRSQFDIFDGQGQARQREKAIQEVQTALEMMEDLQISSLNKEIKKIQNLLPQLFDFLPKAQVIQYQLEAKWGATPTYFWIYAWQNEKKSRKIKDYAKSQVFVEKSKIALELLQEHLELSDKEFDLLKNTLFRQLDTIIQSSALVETINSILRPYMNGARNQVSQEQFNLIRFYLNHRVYKRGKRKGFAPIELLRGKKMDSNWCEQLLKLAS